MLLLLFSGMPCAGKSTAINILKEKFKVEVINMGDLVRKEIKEKNLNIDLRSYSREIRKKDKSYVAKLCIKELMKNEKTRENLKNFVIIDGVRNYEEVEEFKKFYECILISIHASPKKRFERYLSRKRQDDILDFDGFLKRDIEELSWGLGNVIALSDLIIMNEDDDIEKFKENLIKDIEKFFKLS
ncbi:MAG: nucleoside monophosphate kinase [Candidatus Altarchaeaceae archaeon]